MPKLFWSDLAAGHHYNVTTKWSKANKVDIIEKHMNPPNCPEVRPIERYWALMKIYLQKNTKAAISLADLKKSGIRLLKA